MWERNLSALQRDIEVAERHLDGLRAADATDLRECLMQARLLESLRAQQLTMRQWARHQEA